MSYCSSSTARAVPSGDVARIVPFARPSFAALVGRTPDVVGVAQLAAGELAHPSLLLSQELEVAGSLFGVELGLVGGLERRLGLLYDLATTEDPAQEPHRAYS
jgi:hypothetical protein